MIRDILTTLLLVLLFALIVFLGAYALYKNPQLNPKPAVQSSERLGP